MSVRNLVLLLLFASSPGAFATPIERIWLGCPEATPEKITISWVAPDSGAARVEFGPTRALGKTMEGSSDGEFHRATIPVPREAPLYYRIHTGGTSSAIHQLRDQPTQELRVVVIADAGYAKQAWGAAVLNERPHLLMTAGDNVSALHSDGKPVDPDDCTAFVKLIATAPELFATTPFLPALGNHDREIRSRGPKPPAEAVYDIKARAFRRFFVLPKPECTWTLTLPDFGARFAALDLNHLGDFGTTWQTCHPFDRNSAQFAWFQDVVQASHEPFLVTIYNEQNSRVRGLEGGEWGRMISRGSLAVTGFGYFAERAEVNGFPYYNTSVSGTGSRYPDSKSVALHSADNYLLLRFRKDASAEVELKSLEGMVLDRNTVPRRQFPDGSAVPQVE